MTTVWPDDVLGARACYVVDVDPAGIHEHDLDEPPVGVTIEPQRQVEKELGWSEGGFDEEVICGELR
jgi:hypothetical protein